MPDETLCTNIQSQCVVHFFYKGGERTVEPFCYGVSRAGNELLRAYQREGFSQSGQPAGWKLFRVADISNLVPREERFQPRTEYNPNDPVMARIYCAVPAPAPAILPTMVQQAEQELVTGRVMTDDQIRRISRSAVADIYAEASDANPEVLQVPRAELEGIIEAHLSREVERVRHAPQLVALIVGLILLIVGVVLGAYSIPLQTFLHSVVR